MLINAAPRTYTSNIVADADLNLEGYSVTANALYSKDNYLLTMLDYGEAFPTDVKEGDKLFSWGEDSTKSYIYTYKQGAWDAGVKPQHMQDYYIADENRIVKFCLLKGSSSSHYVYSHWELGSWYVLSSQLLTFDPNVYILGDFSALLFYNHWGTDTKVFVIPNGSYFEFRFTDCTTVLKGSSRLNIAGVTLSPDEKEYMSVVVPSGVNAFNSVLALNPFSVGGGELYVGVCYEFDL